ncbi:MAG: hypothetical protein LH468_09605 [Nocardioides sp.]|nr:hypothetical protein [Nocardioides sp.]
MAHRTRTVILCAALGLAAGLLVVPQAPTAQAAPEDLIGRLVLEGGTFAPGEPDQRRFTTRTPAGTDEQVLLELGVDKQFNSVSRPDWSPDGARFAFAGRPAVASLPDIWVMDADASNPVQLTDAPDHEESPTWSPDGSMIAYVSDALAPDRRFDIWVMDADGSNERLLLQWPELPDQASLSAISWHPSQSVLVAQAGLNLYTINVDQPAAELLFSSPGSAIDLPAWSPDGSTLAVTVEVTGVNYETFLIDPDDGTGVNLTNTPNRSEYGVAWSPDGTALAWGQFDGFFVFTGVWIHELGPGTTTQVIAIDPNVESLSVRGWIADPPADPDRVDTAAAAGQTVGTDPEGDGATSQDPVETSVTTPNAGVVRINETPVSGDPPAGYEFVGQQVSITAPAATPEAPLVLSFRIDATVLPDATSAQDVVPFRNGTPVADCAGAPGVASPDPCRASAVLETDGDVTVVVLTSAASTWNLGIATVAPDTTPPLIALTTPRDGASYGRDQAAAADYGCSDEQSGVTRCEGPRPDGSLLATTTLGVTAFRVDAADAAGNTASASATYRVVSRRNVVPTVTCVSRGAGGWWSARFGYQNRNPYRILLPTGTRNGFTTAPADRAQPTSFAPGVVGRAVDVAFRTSVTWRLDGTSATARRSARRC